MKLFPKETDFFALFDKAAANATHAATLLVGIMEHFSNLEAWAREVHELEQEGDMVTHDIIRKLNKTFVTPIDREDIHALASTLDDIVDLIWAAADRLTVFRMKESTKWAITMSKDLLTTVEFVEKAIKKLREKNYPHIQEYSIEINKLENRLDRSFRDALGHLFDEMQDPILIIKWKEIYEHLEDASDKCEDVANILEAIVLKNA
jgi:predicted phosphate transport protein (TIGR00153 family)